MFLAFIILNIIRMGKTRRVKHIKRVRTRKMSGGNGYHAGYMYGPPDPGNSWHPTTTTKRSWGSFFRRHKATTTLPPPHPFPTTISRPPPPPVIYEKHEIDNKINNFVINVVTQYSKDRETNELTEYLIGKKILLTPREKIILKNFKKLTEYESKKELDDAIYLLESGDEIATFPPDRAHPVGNIRNSFNHKKNWNVRRHEPNIQETNKW